MLKIEFLKNIMYVQKMNILMIDDIKFKKN